MKATGNQSRGTPGMISASWLQHRTKRISDMRLFTTIVYLHKCSFGVARGVAFCRVTAVQTSAHTTEAQLVKPRHLEGGERGEVRDAHAHVHVARGIAIRLCTQRHADDAARGP